MNAHLPSPSGDQHLQIPLMEKVADALQYGAISLLLRPLDDGRVEVSASLRERLSPFLENEDIVRITHSIPVPTHAAQLPDYVAAFIAAIEHSESPGACVLKENVVEQPEFQGLLAYIGLGVAAVSLFNRNLKPLTQAQT